MSCGGFCFVGLVCSVAVVSCIVWVCRAGGQCCVGLGRRVGGLCCVGLVCRVGGLCRVGLVCRVDTMGVVSALCPRCPSSSQKQRQHGMIKLWNRRWFELSGLHLSYSHSREANIYKTFDLSNFRLVDCNLRKFAFCLVEHQGKVILRLACANDEEQSRWWQAIVKGQKEMMSIRPLHGALHHRHTLETMDVSPPSSTEDGRPFLSRYQRLDFVGRGTSGKLWKVRDKVCHAI